MNSSRHSEAAAEPRQLEVGHESSLLFRSFGYTSGPAASKRFVREDGRVRGAVGTGEIFRARANGFSPRLFVSGKPSAVNTRDG